MSTSAVTPSSVFRRRTKAVRERRHMTQEALADRLGLDRTSVIRLERGGREVSLDKAFVIAAALNVSPLWLLLPSDDEAVAVGPGTPVTGEQIKSWLRGDEPLPGGDRRDFLEASPDAWIQIFGSKPERVLHGLVTAFAEAWESADVDSAGAALDALEAETKRQRSQLRQMAGRRKDNE